MKKLIVRKKKEPWLIRLKFNAKRFSIVLISLICSVLYVLVSILASNTQELLKPYLISIGAPKIFYSSFTLYATIFVVIGYINKNIIKKQIDMEADLDCESIDEDVLRDIENLDGIRNKYEAEIARKDSIIASKEKMIDALLQERQGKAEMDFYNQVEGRENKTMGGKATHNKSSTTFNLSTPTTISKTTYKY